MSNPLVHAERSARKWGGSPDLYLPIHRWFDSSKAVIPDNRHRMLLHHSFGILLAEQVFGSALEISPTRRVFVREIGAQHVLEDLGLIPTPAQCLAELPLSPWMAGAGKLALRPDNSHLEGDHAGPDAV